MNTLSLAEECDLNDRLRDHLVVDQHVRDTDDR